MREILFRGKHRDEGFVYGYVGVFKGLTQIYVPFTEEEEKENQANHSFLRSAIGGLWYQVDPSTVGQYTGLCDKNGKKIFEGDIVKQTFEKTVAVATIDPWCEDEYADLYGEDVGVVVILPSKGACIKNPVIHRAVNGDTTQDGEVVKMYKNICQGRCEVIGTIHDNPELLEVSHE